MDGQSVDVLVIQRGGYVDIIQLVVVSVENYTKSIVNWCQTAFLYLTSG